MAIKILYEWKGIPIPECHCTVSSISVTSAKDSMDFQLVFRTSVDGEAFHSEVLSCPYDINGENPFKQAYLYLITTPNFSDAVEI